MALTCPRCGSDDILEIIWGLPSGPPDPEERAAYGGCVVSDDDPSHECASCGHRFGHYEEPEAEPSDLIE